MALINKLKNIGNAIREKTGIQEEMTLDEMATNIMSIQSGEKRGEFKTMLVNIPFNTSLMTVKMPEDFQFPCFISVSASSGSTNQSNSLTFSSTSMRYNFIMVDYNGEKEWNNLKASLLNCKQEDGGTTNNTIPYYTGIKLNLSTNGAGEANRTFVITPYGTEYFAGVGKSTGAKAKIYYWTKGE